MGDPRLLPDPDPIDALFARILDLPRGPAVAFFLDVDGVLNLEEQCPACPMRPDDWPTYRRDIVQTSTQPAVPVIWSPELVDCINLLVERGQVEVCWLTSWGLDAPLCAAPAIGLAAGRRVAHDDHLDEMPWWKLRVVRRFAATGEFCVWADDFIDEEVGTESVQAMTGGRVLSLCPSATRGLTPRHLHVIIDAIAELRRTPDSGLDLHSGRHLAHCPCRNRCVEP